MLGHDLTQIDERFFKYFELKSASRVLFVMRVDLRSIELRVAILDEEKYFSNPLSLSRLQRANFRLRSMFK